MSCHLSLFILVFITALSSTAEEHPALFLTAGKSFHEEEFDGKKIPPSVKFRSGSKGKLDEGVLVVVNPSSTKDARPVFHFSEVPESLVCHMRVKFDGDTYKPKNPWLDIGGGHRNHFRFTSESVAFSSEDKELTKRKIDNVREEEMLPLNEWLHITIEMKNGKIGLSINGNTQIYEEDQIEMGQFPKIAIKAVPKGKLLVDYIRVWELADK